MLTKLIFCFHTCKLFFLTELILFFDCACLFAVEWAGLMMMVIQQRITPYFGRSAVFGIQEGKINNQSYPLENEGGG